MIDLPNELTEPLADLGVLLTALGPYREEAIVIGGMVPVMYRHLDSTLPTQNLLLASFDLDITMPEKLSAPGLTQRLTESGFISGIKGSNHPPVSIFHHKRHGPKRKQIYVEILAPLKGSSSTRGDRLKSTIPLEPGLNAQALRYIDVVQYKPITIDGSQVPALGIDEKLVFKIPHPSMYIAQKLLCRKERRVKLDKDLAYIFDTVSLFRNTWSELGTFADAATQDVRVYRKWIKQARQDLSNLFGSETADGPVAVENVYADLGAEPTISRDIVYAVMKRFIDASGLGQA